MKTETQKQDAGGSLDVAAGFGFLTPDDSKRVADALISAIENARIDITNRHDAMCQTIASQHFYAEQQRINPPRY